MTICMENALRRSELRMKHGDFTVIDANLFKSKHVPHKKLMAKYRHRCYYTGI